MLSRVEHEKCFITLGPGIVCFLTDSSLLIIRSMISRFLYPSLTWRGETTITPTTEIQYKYRFLCLPNFYGSRCDVSCRPRDDLFGHYTCGENGTKICMPGWDSTFCDKGESGMILDALVWCWYFILTK